MGVVAEDRRAPTLLDQHRFRLRAQGDAHGVAQQRGAVQDLRPGRGAEQDLLVSHRRPLHKIPPTLPRRKVLTLIAANAFRGAALS
jgi:hypothetical protein